MFFLGSALKKSFFLGSSEMKWVGLVPKCVFYALF